MVHNMGLRMCPFGEDGKDEEVKNVKAEDIKIVYMAPLFGELINEQPLPTTVCLTEKDVNLEGIMDIKFEKEEMWSPKTDRRQCSSVALSTEHVVESANNTILCPKKLVAKVRKLPVEMLTVYSSTIGKLNVLFECDICSQTFLKKPSLVSHMRKHKNPKPTKCTVCLKEFRCYAALIIHQTVHSGEKTFKCGQCSKMFSRKYSLQSHMTVHSDALFECFDCHKQFQRKSTLLTHQHLRDLSHFRVISAQNRSEYETLLNITCLRIVKRSTHAAIVH